MRDNEGCMVKKGHFLLNSKYVYHQNVGFITRITVNTYVVEYP
jgi:hypothetical protein